MATTSRASAQWKTGLPSADHVVRAARTMSPSRVTAKRREPMTDEASLRAASAASLLIGPAMSDPRFESTSAEGIEVPLALEIALRAADVRAHAHATVPAKSNATAAKK